MKKFKIDFKNKTTTQAVIEAIRNYIIDNEVQPGDCLPTEKELATLLNVSRTIIREALQHFKVLGIIDSRRKAGIKIRLLLPENPYESYIPYMQLDKESAENLLEMRIIIELGMSDILIEKASADNIKKLRLITEKMSDVKSSKQIAKYDLEFHTYLFEIIDNSFIDSIKGLVVDYFNSTEQSINNLSAEILSENNKRTHLEIVNALKKRSNSKLRNAIKEHYKALFDVNRRL